MSVLYKLKWKIAKVRSTLGLIPLSSLVRQYIESGSSVQLIYIRLRLAVMPSLVRKIYPTAPNYPGLSLLHIVTAYGESDYRWQRESTDVVQAHVSRVKLHRSQMITRLLLQHGADPFRKEPCRVFGQLSLIEHLTLPGDYPDKEFAALTISLIEEHEAGKRGAHLDAVLPLVDALEDAPAPKRARL